GMIITQLHIPPESSMLMMQFLPVIAIATIGFIVFERKEKLQKLNLWQATHYVATLSIGIFIVEFLAFFVHALASIFIAADSLTPEVEYWLIIATIYSGVGGVILGTVYYYSERIDRWIFSRVNPKYAMLVAASFVIIVASLSLWMNPQIHEFIL
ncbi:MAG: hypothetical protein GWN40_05070, partial [Nitrosopumilaceae archaeon]|nr:hypothetical protein [Nitrosopumilaceae archaeon]